MDSGAKGDLPGENLLGEIVPLSWVDATLVKEVADVCFPDAWALGDFEFFLKHPSAFHFGAKRDDKLLAYFLSFNVQGDVDIISIACDPNFRRRGVAEHLLKSVLAQVEVMTVSLEVDVENSPAVKLYEKCGFIRHGLRKNYYQGKRDALRMWFEKRSS